jgi:hypothetical protein
VFSRPILCALVSITQDLKQFLNITSAHNLPQAQLQSCPGFLAVPLDRVAAETCVRTPHYVVTLAHEVQRYCRARQGTHIEENEERVYGAERGGRAGPGGRERRRKSLDLWLEIDKMR